jgi:hypothetical protein
MGWMSAPKVNTKAVDTAAASQAATSSRMAAIAEQEYADGKARNAEFDPLFKQLVQQQMDSSALNDQRATEMWDTQKRLYMPAEEKLASAALNYDTAGRRDEAAAAAAGEVGQQFGNAREAQMRGLGRAGVSLSAGRGATLDAAARLEQAKATAGAKVAARNQVEQTGLSLLDNTVKTGRGLTSSALGASQLGLQGASAAGGTIGQSQAAYNASLAPASTMYGGAVQAGSAAGNLYLGSGQLRQGGAAAGAANMAGLGQLAGTLGGMYMAGAFSSKKLKRNKRKPKGLEDAALDGVSKLKVEGWDYKPGVEDEGTHVGPYAEDTQAQFGDEVAPGGKMIDLKAMSGKNQLAIKALTERLARMEQQLAEA